MTNTIDYNPDGSPVAKDVLSKVINIGDKIIYSAVDGRSAVLRRGTVTDIYVKADRYRDNIKLSVEAERRGYNGNWNPMSSKVSLSYLSRVLVVDRRAW